MTAVACDMLDDFPGQFEPQVRIVSQDRRGRYSHKFGCGETFAGSSILLPESLCLMAGETDFDENSEIDVVLTDTVKIHPVWGEQFRTRILELLRLSREEEEQSPSSSSVRLVIEIFDAFKPSIFPDVALEYDGTLYVGWSTTDRTSFVSMIAKLDGQIEYAYRHQERIGSGHCMIGGIFQEIPKSARQPMYG